MNPTCSETTPLQPMISVLPPVSYQRTLFIKDICNLCNQARILQNLAPQIAQGTLEAVLGWANKVADMLQPEEAWKILLALGTPSLERALNPNTTTPETKLLHRSTPTLPKSQGPVHSNILGLSQTALDRLRHLGYPYDTLLEPATAATMWLERGASFGATAWRTRYPRKNPVLTYWFHNGFHLPEHGLCPEGLDMMEATIRTLGNAKYIPQKLQETIYYKGASLRVALAFCTVGDPLKMRKTKVFPPEWKPFVDTAFPDNPTGHQALAAAALRNRLPSIRSLLSMHTEPPTPNTILLSSDPIHT